MLLVEINRRRVAGIGHDETMRVMQAAASQPRVLTLARVGSIRPPPATSYIGSADTETRPEDTTSGYTKRSLTQGHQLSVTSHSAAEGNASRWTTPSCSLRQPLPGESTASPWSHSAVSSSDGDAWSAGGFAVPPVAPLKSAMLSRVYSMGTTLGNRVQQEWVLPLRFVGSRGDLSLYDRDHILGLKKRNIEFVPSSASSVSRSSRANSRRSLGDLAIDWRSDPCSTPARRRRLINDVCEVIVRSYARASVARVAELRRQHMSVARIQAAARMWATRRRFVAHLAECRAKAALRLQLGWLSFVARWSVSVLREERDHARRVAEAKRKKRLAREEAERRHNEDERKRAEKEVQEGERQQREQELVVFVQRRFRALQVSMSRTAFSVSIWYDLIVCAEIGIDYVVPPRRLVGLKAVRSDHRSLYARSVIVLEALSSARDYCIFACRHAMRCHTWRRGGFHANSFRKNANLGS